jgi:NIPSNAP
MNRRALLMTLAAGAVAQAGTQSMKALAAEPGSGQGSGDAAEPAGKVYEFRVYHCYEGKLDDLLARFRNHTVSIFKRHGLRSVAYWTPLDDPLKGRTLFYVLAHPSREAADVNWKAFREDPEWIKVRDASEANGKLVEKVDSTYLALTDYSAVV